MERITDDQVENQDAAPIFLNHIVEDDTSYAKYKVDVLCYRLMKKRNFLELHGIVTTISLFSSC